MLVDLARPLTLVLCMCSLCAVFNAAFLDSAIDMSQRIGPALARLAIAAAICVLSGLLFLAPRDDHDVKAHQLSDTLPVQLLFWASGIMAIVFLVSWYLQVHCVFFRSTRVW